MALIDEIKTKYPSPQAACYDTIPATSRSAGDYCVGGAICMTAGNMTQTFPTTYILAIALRELNPALPSEHALAYAALIITNNDVENFDEAWEIARQALAYQP